MIDTTSPEKTQDYTPPLGYKILTPLYDFVIAALTREGVWRKAFVREIAPQPGDRILDIGSGTGSLVMALHKVSPEIIYVGVDPDPDAVRRAKKKTSRLGGNIRFVLEHFSAAAAYFDQPPDKIVSSLVLHQVPLTEKHRIIKDIFRMLPSGGAVHIADYGYQQSKLMRALFRLTVQAIDGVSDTQPNADGVIPEILEQAGFLHVCEVKRIPTLTGTISIYSGQKP
jgi:ubiquinone/menaquinone biosynthesis C-methylase UbiE